MTEEKLYQEMYHEFLPVFRKLAGTEDYSITLSGSRGKKTADRNSDFDFRIYYEKPANKEEMRQAFEEINCLCEKWKQRNVLVDGIWPRTYAQVEEQLEQWLTGRGQTEPYVWTIWGYHILTDLYNQQIIEDSSGRVARWKERLAVYPEPLKKAILQKHTASLAYWQQDYHYWNKVQSGDVVFLASLTARLIQDMMQVLFALNECYYPGDGWNLKYARQFACIPNNFEERVTDILQIPGTGNALEEQYRKMADLTDEVLELAKKAG